MSKNNYVEASHQQYHPPPPQMKSLHVVSEVPKPLADGHQANPPVVGMPVREKPPLACGIGFGWILFILGFFLTVIPWYLGAIIFLCSKIDRRERPGCIACTVGAVFATILIIVIVVTHGGSHHHYH